MIRVLLADDHAIVREGLRLLLEREDIRVVGEAADGREAVRVARQHQPDVAVLDFAMPLLNGVDAVREVAAVSPNTRSIVLSMYAEEQYVLRALEAGARGYVLKSQASEDLVRAIHAISKDHAYLSPGISRAVVDAYLSKNPKNAVPSDRLTPRERQLLQLIAEGKTTKEAAVLLGVSVKTAETHRTRMMAKLGVHGTAGLVRHAIRLGLVRP